MKNKKMFVLGIALILMAVVAGGAFAHYLNGVTWSVSEGGTYGYTMYLYNNNDYRVHCKTSRGQVIILKAYEEGYMNCGPDTTLSSVTKY